MFPLVLASNHSDEFYAMATEKGKDEAKKYYASAEKEKTKFTTRLHELDNIIRCLYLEPSRCFLTAPPAVPQMDYADLHHGKTASEAGYDCLMRFFM